MVKSPGLILRVIYVQAEKTVMFIKFVHVQNLILCHIHDINIYFILLFINLNSPSLTSTNYISGLLLIFLHSLSLSLLFIHKKQIRIEYEETFNQNPKCLGSLIRKLCGAVTENGL